MENRNLRILDLLNERAEVRVAQLPELLGVSGTTVRKALADMEREGLIRRAFGVIKQPDHEIGTHLGVEYDAKKRIARSAAALVSDHETVMIESGSTCALLALELMRTKQGIRIITNSVYLAGQSKFCPGSDILLLGGVYDAEEQVVTGPLVRSSVHDIYVEKLFFGTDGYDERQGFTNVSLHRAEAVRNMAERAEERIVLTASSKFQKRGVARIMPTEEISLVVTDAIPDSCRAGLAEKGVRVLIAD